MDDSLKHMLKEFDDLKGQLIIADGKVERFVGIGEDEIDYIYLLFNGRTIHGISALDYIIPLKGHITDKNYKRLVSDAELNHMDFYMDPEKFKEELDKEVKTKTGWFEHYVKIWTELCFEIN